MGLRRIALALVVAASLGSTQDTTKIQERTSAQEKAIDKGVRWLIDTQNRQGSWGCEANGAPSTAITALAALALASSGSTPHRGPHREKIALAIDRLVRVQQRSGAITLNDSTGMGLMYDHSCATLALAEFHGMRDLDEPDGDALAAPLRLAIRYLYQRQNRDGGWDAQGMGGGNSDLAITCNVWLALRSAHNAGMTIENANVGRVEQFVKRCVEPSGGFNQYPSMRRGGGGRMFYPTSAGLRILYGMGRGESKEVEKGVELLMRKKLGDDYGGQISEWDYCGGFFAVMALLHENGKGWATWYPKLREQLIKIQNPDGSWTIQYCLCCRAYATALSVLMLEAPNRLLPLYQL